MEGLGHVPSKTPFNVACCAAVSFGCALIHHEASVAQSLPPPSPPPPTSPQASGDATATTMLNGDVELVRLLELAAQRLGYNLEYDPALLQGQRVTLRLAGPVADRELWLLTNRILALRGFTTVRYDAAESAGDDEEAAPPGEEAWTNPTFGVVRLADAAGVAGIQSVTVTEGTVLEAGAEAAGGYQTLVVPVRFADAKTLAETLKGAVLSRQGAAAVPVDAGAGRSYLLISDLGARVAQALDLLLQIDAPGRTPTVERLTIENTSASRLAATATALAAAMETLPGHKAPLGKILPDPAGGEHAVVLVAPLERLDQAAPVETRTYSPRYFGIDEVADLVERTVVGASATISDGGDGNRWRLVRDELTGTLIVTATPEQHEQIEALLKRLNDVPAEARRPMRTFTVRNRSVTEMVGIVERLLASGVLDAQTATDLQSGEGSLDRVAPRERGATAPGATGDRVEPSAGSSMQSMPPPPTTDGPASASRLPEPQSTSSSDAGTSRRLRTDEETPASGGGRRGTTNGSASTGASQPALSLTADEATGTIIAVGEPRLLDQVERLIRNLDVRQPQVMLEILIVLLNEGQTLDLGVELEKIEIASDVRITLSSLFGLSTEEDDGSRTLTDPQGGSAVVLSPGDFSVVLRALQTVNQGQSLNVPKVLVGNNEQAVLNSVLQQPYVSTNASDTVATTSFGGTADAGTTVTVKPRIAEADHLVLTYSVSLSSFVGESTDPALPPPRQENLLQSVATIPDGYVVAMGGLDVRTSAKAVSQVPGLGSIPVLGELFKSRSNSGSRSRFFVFIRPTVLRHLNFEDLKYASEVDWLEARSAGVNGLKEHEAWPEVKPRIIR